MTEIHGSSTNFDSNFKFLFMRKKILVYGSIAGLICIAWPLGFMSFGTTISVENSELFGYLTMIIAFSMIAVAVKSVRDKDLGGSITFWRALKTGLLTTLVASTVYVGIWLIYYYSTGDNSCFDQHIANYFEEMRKSGASAAAIAKEQKEMEEFMMMYQNPFFNALITYTEILPVGILVSLITAIVLRRKPKETI